MKLIPSLLWCAAIASGAVGNLADQIPIELNQSTTNPLTLDAIPLLGFGTWNLKENCTEAVSHAIQIGYRHIDAAAIYGNENYVGLGIADGLLKAGLKREDLWITSKLWNDHHDPNLVDDAIDRTLRMLGIEYLDLYHMHWPVKDGFFGGKSIEYRDTWNAMTRLVESGKTRHIGVCNFSPGQLDDLLNHTSYPPDVHQLEMHPYLAQNKFLYSLGKRGIHVTAYSPLAGTNPTYDPGAPPQLLKNKKIVSIAEKRGCTPAQVVLAWGMSRGTSVIPKSSHLERITENFHALECVLKKKDLKKIDKLRKEYYRFNNPSKSWGVPLYEGLEDSEGKHKKHS